MPREARHQASTLTTPTVYTLAGQSCLRPSDTTTAHEASNKVLDVPSKTCFHATAGGAAQLLTTSAVADRGVRTSSTQTAVRHGSEGTSYSRGALLAVQCGSKAPEANGPTISASYLTLPLTNYCSPGTICISAKVALQEARSCELSRRVDNTEETHSDETTFQDSAVSWPTPAASTTLSTTITPKGQELRLFTKRT